MRDSGKQWSCPVLEISLSRFGIEIPCNHFGWRVLLWDTEEQQQGYLLGWEE